MTRAQRVALDSLASYLRFGVALGVQFVLVPIVIDKVGTADYGLWTLTFSVLGLLTLVDFGFGTGVMRFVAEARGANDPERRNRIVSTVMVVYGVLAFIAAAAVGVISLFYGDLFDIPVDMVDRAYALLWILAGRSVLVTLPMGIFRSILFGEQRIALVNLIQAVTTLLYGVAAWVTLEAELGILGLAWANLLVLLVEHLAYVAAAFGLIRDLKVTRSRVDRESFGETASVSIYQFIVNVSSLVLLRTDPMIIKFFMPLTSVALFGVALKVAENVLLLLKQGINVLGPLVAELKGRGDTRTIRVVLVSGSKFAFAPAVVLMAGAWVYSREGLLYWVGPEFLEAAPVLQLLMTAMALMVPQMVASGVFTMTGLHKLTARLAVLSMIVHLGLAVALIVPFGLVGVALATLVATVLVDVFMVVHLASRHFGVGLKEYTARVFWPAFWPGIAAFGAMWGLKVWAPPADLGTVFLQGIPGTVIYALLFWRFCLEPEELRLIRERLLKRKT